MRQQFRLMDLDLTYEEQGSGQPVLLFHGGGGPENLLGIVDRLSETHRVIVPVLPGFAGEDEPEWLQRPADAAYFYLALINALALENVILIGHSLGGWIAAEMAIRDQSRLAGLVLVSSGGIHVKGVSKGDNFLWTAEQTLRNFFANQKIAERLLAENRTDPMLAIRRQRIVAKLVWRPRWYEPQLQKWLKRIAIPTQIIWGDSDKLFPAQYAQAFADQIKGARLSILQDCGHIPFVEKKDEFMQILTTFLKEL